MTDSLIWFITGVNVIIPADVCAVNRILNLFVLVCIKFLLLMHIWMNCQSWLVGFLTFLWLIEGMLQCRTCINAYCCLSPFKFVSFNVYLFSEMHRNIYEYIALKVFLRSAYSVICWYYMYHCVCGDRQLKNAWVALTTWCWTTLRLPILAGGCPLLKIWRSLRRQ